MDEHDKRAREVVEQVIGNAMDLSGAFRALVAARFAALLRSTAAAAERRGQDAERERCAELVEHGEVKTIGHLDPAAAVEWHRRDFARRIRSASTAAASPAQAERVSEEQGATARLGALLAEAGARLTITPELVGSNGDPDVAQRVADAHARGCRETQVRIAARLRARADELDTGWPERSEFAASVLRSEADALEGT